MTIMGPNTAVKLLLIEDQGTKWSKGLFRQRLVVLSVMWRRVAR